MTSRVLASQRYVLYGAPHSLYTGKVRCYLRKQRIDYLERLPSHPAYVNEIAPAIGRNIIPVIVTPNGQIIQDSIDIIDHFEARGVPYSAYPSAPLQCVLAVLIEYYGNQSLLRHAMHYRWSYLADQRVFLEHAFAARSDRAIAERVMARMQSYLPQLGVTPLTISAIERSYERLLEILDEHFAHHPYLLGGRPTLADYGMIGPLFAHLGRDPVPARLMKTRAPRVFRWVERMNAPDLDAPEFVDESAELIARDAVPPSLEPLLVHMREEVFPELIDKLAFLDLWIAKHAPRDGDPVSAKAHQRRIGVVQTMFRSLPIEAGVEPYLVYQLRRADRVLDMLDQSERARVVAALAQRGLADALIGERKYSVDRRNHIEVWASPT